MTDYYEEYYYEDDEVYVSEALFDFSFKNKHGKKFKLKVLDDELRRIHKYLECSKKRLQDIIKNLGICLSNCIQYGSIHQLRTVLRNNGRLRYPKSEIKKYEFVKFCLIKI